MRIDLRVLLVPALLAVTAAAYGDGGCTEYRKYTTQEKAWLRDRDAAIHRALPPAPAGWISYSREDLEGAPAPRAIDAPPLDSVCTEFGARPLEYTLSQYYTPRNSAVARDIELRRTLARIDQQMGAASPAAVAPGQDMMRVQQELMAAQARGDGATMQAALEKLSQQSDATAAGTDRVTELGNQRYAAQNELVQIESDGSVARAVRVRVTGAINQWSSYTREPAWRDLKLVGAHAAWLDPHAETCSGSEDRSETRAVVLFGKFAEFRDDTGAVVEYRRDESVKAYIALRDSSFTVCGDPDGVKRFLRLIRFDAVRR